MSNVKHPRYQDYVIKDGVFIGEFDEMYKDFEDPWYQSKESLATDKSAVIHLMHKYGIKKAIEIGCGHGHFTNNIRKSGISVIGIDISPTAINKARIMYPSCQFIVADILDREVYRSFRPDAIILSEVTWYVLDKIDEFIVFIKKEFPSIYLIHLLVTYKPEVQKYGTDKFTNLSEIMKYFGMKYIEWGEIYKVNDDTIKTFFIGQWK